MSVTLVLDPGTTFAAVAGELATWDGGPTDRHPLLAGEPIGASWRRGGDRVAYSANPAIRLRVLTIEGPGGQRVAADLAARLPLLDARTARGMIGSADREAALLGATAAGLRHDLAAIPALKELARRRDRELAAAARLALQRIGSGTVAAGAARVAERRRRRPGRDPLFELAGPPATRRQVVRWLAVDPPADTGRAAELLLTAMEDGDWEVRWSAVLAAHALGTAELALAVKRCPPADRVDRTDRQILEAARETVGCRLTGATPRHPGTDRIAACLAGRPGRYDRAFLLLHALRQPLPVTRPEPVPHGFTWVPPVVHWLGSDDPDVPGNPIRAARPGRGVAVSTRPLDLAAAEAVPRRLAELAAELGHPLELPTVEVLEMAVRGPDGRRFPWGNGREPGWRGRPSPWGLEEPVAEPQWATLDGRLVTLGGADGRCAGPVGRPARACLRPVLAERCDSGATLR